LSSKYHIVDDALVEHIAAAPEKEQGRWLILEEHPDFSGQWAINCLDPHFYYEFESLIGSYRALPPSKLDDFLEISRELDYEVAFGEDPTSILDAYVGLNDDPPFELNSDLPKAEKGFLPFQRQGFNKLKDLDAGVALWSTGTGKTVLATAYVKYHVMKDDFDLCLFTVKSSNKINTQRKLETLAGINSVVVSGPPKWRRQVYENVLRRLSEGERGIVMVLNYEKYRDDFAETYENDEGNEVQRLLPEYMRFWEGEPLYVWDEMPMKLKNRGNLLYSAVCKILYHGAPAVNWEKKRAKRLRQLMLSATPIENDPENWFNNVRLLDPRIYGTVAEFRAQFVASYNYFNRHKPESWHELEKIGLMAAHIVHEVDKEKDPEIRAMFPDVIEEPYYIDWSDSDRKVYDTVTGKAKGMLADFDVDEVLALIGLMQMLCDAPSMVNDSAARREAYERALESFEESFDMEAKAPSPEGSEAAIELLIALDRVLTDDKHSKLHVLKQLLTEDHPNEKTCVFTTWNDAFLPKLSAYLTEWGVSHVVYRGSDAQKQVAQDAFREDPDIQVFLSSDAGSDSIDLEQASVVIHYNLPWKWSTFIQRQNRIHRVTSQYEVVRYYVLMMADSVEDRKLKIVERKKGYHKGVFGGAITDEAMSARMTREELVFILTGEG
jgi:hypothetical protein